MTPSDQPPRLRLGHSPDPDDVFMWWPLFERDGRPPPLDTGRFRFDPVLADIETLNHRSQQGDLEITAISCAQYPHVKDRYALTACGSSMGDQYGPKLVSGRPMEPDQLRRGDLVIAVPGERTSAFAATSLWLGPGSFRYQVVDFDQIIERVADGEFAAGLIIHEGQLTFERAGLHLVADIGFWWSSGHQLPLPLGVNAIRLDLDEQYGPGTLGEVTAILLRSVKHALAHRQEAITHARCYARDMPDELVDRFVGMYVNRWTLDFGASGREAVRVFLGETSRAGLTPDPGPVAFVDAVE